MNILQFGAVSGGKVLCTEAIQQAIDACATAGGGRVTVPAGEFLTGTIWLKSHVELHLESGAVLKASADLKNYNDDSLDRESKTDFSQNLVCVQEEWRGKHLIIALECEDVALTGLGTIDGSADCFFQKPYYSNSLWNNYYYSKGWCWSEDKENLRPGQLVCFYECQKVKINDITVTNAPCWNIFLYGCDYIQIRGIRVFNPPWFINTDGIDLDCCAHATVSDCVIETGDDGITVRSDPSRLSNRQKKSEDITITNCSISSECHAFRIGVGDGEIEHIRISDITISHCGGGALCFTGSWENKIGTAIHDVRISHITAAQAGWPIIINASEHGFSNIFVNDFYCTAFCRVEIFSQNPKHCRKITLQDVVLTFVDRGIELNDEIRNEIRGCDMVAMRNVSNLVWNRLRISVKDEVRKAWNQYFEITNCPNFSMNGLTID